MYRIMRKINLLTRCQASFMMQRLKDLQLGSCHHSYLLTVSGKPGISQEALARDLCVNKSNVTRNLAYLEQQGYVERRSSPLDKRVMQVYPTEKLHAALPQVRSAARDWNAYLTAEFTVEELQQFQRALDRILERAQTYMEHGKEAAD